ncbi:MAG: pilus assembly protein [Planctomycetaceae bacterium]|nr:pilus assembly protein [Planctomycetaceae bacterium]
MFLASHHRCRRGQALVEFAAIALVFAVMLGAMLSLGHMFFAAHTIQQAVDVAAQEIARTPFPAASELGLGSFDDEPDSVMETELFKEQIFDERHLVIDPDDYTDPKEYWDGPGPYSLVEASKRLPLLNRLLVSAMVFDPTFNPNGLPYRDPNHPDYHDLVQGVYRYPGAVVTYDDNGVPRETVVVPLVQTTYAPVSETVYSWVKPVEEIKYEGTGSFSVVATVPPMAPANPSFQPGMVALRINYPFQAAGLVKYVPTGSFSATDPNLPMTERITASDGGTESTPGFVSLPAGKYQLAVASDADPFDAMGTSRVNSGRFGLGRLSAYKPSAGALGVRPYRRVITAQAIYRREVFE